MFKELISKKEFIGSVEAELKALVKTVKTDYRATVDLLSKEFTEQSYELLNATTEEEAEKARRNIAHIKASLAHISARISMDLSERLIAITSIAITVAVTAAIKAII